MAPEFKKAATTLKAENVLLAAVDATLDENKDLASEHGVKGFPTLKVWNKRQGNGWSDYEGGRSEDTIVE